MDFQQYWENIYDTSEKLNSLLLDYWREYSYFDDWQFWVAVGFLVVPLILLFFFVDRKRIFEVLFYGYSVHILWNYTDTLLGSSNYFVHKYFAFPLLPYALSLTSSFLPVGFLLVYQFSTNHNKNVYFYTILFAAIFAFILAPLESVFGLIDLHYGMNYFYIFLIDIVIAFLALWLTKFILYLRHN